VTHALRLNSGTVAGLLGAVLSLAAGCASSRPAEQPLDEPDPVPQVDAGRVDAGGLDAGRWDAGGDDDRPADRTCEGEGEAHFVPGCGEPVHPLPVAGCYETCAPSPPGGPDPEPGGGPCRNGGECVPTSIDPCVCPPGEICCDACGAQAWVCLPAD